MSRFGRVVGAVGLLVLISGAARGGGEYAVGDSNCDGAVSFDDIDPFVLALLGEGAYDANWPDCVFLAADADDDGAVDFDDIDGFIACLIAGGCGTRVLDACAANVPPDPPDPRTPGPFAVGRLSDVSLPNAIAATVGSPRFPAISTTVLNFDGRRISGSFLDTGQDAISGFDVRGAVRYPADPASGGGLNAQVAAGGPFPLVVIAHGNHNRYTGAPLPSGGPGFPANRIDPSDENYRGYTYLQDLLATHGYISVSVDLDDFTYLIPGILARAWVVLCHIENMERLNGLGGNLLEDQIDLNTIILIGHSRGGDAVVRAAQMNAQVGGAAELAGPAVGPGTGEGVFGIRAVFAIAATRFFDGATNYGGGVVSSTRLTTDMPFLGMWGDADGDVNGSDLQLPVIPGVLPSAQRTTATHVEGIYDQSVHAPGQLVWIEGANHNFWNTTWSNNSASGSSPTSSSFGDDGYDYSAGRDRVQRPGSSYARLSAVRADNDDLQRDLALIYGAAFVRAYVGGETEFAEYFRRPANDPGLPLVVRERVHVQHQPPTPDREFSNAFEGALPLADFSIVGAVNVVSGTAVELTGADRGAANATQSYYHHTRGVLFTWSSPAGQPAPGVRFTPESTLDVSDFAVLSLRAAQDRRDGNSVTPLTLLLTLEDEAGEVATLASNLVTTIPVADTRLDSSQLTKSMLKTVRMPLCRFVNENPQLDLTRIQRIEIGFGRAAGKAAIDDVEFAR